LPALQSYDVMQDRRHGAPLLMSIAMEMKFVQLKVTGCGFSRIIRANFEAMRRKTV